MPRHQFDKPHLSLDEQIKQLTDRGMHIRDEEQAKEKLRHINYYRLGFYWHEFEEDHNTHKLKEGTDFDEVALRYDFDNELRQIVLAAIGIIEVSFRAQWVHHLTMDHGPHGHLDSDIHDGWWTENKRRLAREVARSNEPFILNQSSKYTEETPALWATCEIMTFGSVSRWYKSLIVDDDEDGTKARIGQFYGLSISDTAASIYHLSVVRNACAHHNRLWNTRFDRAAVPRISRLSQELVEGKPLYNTLVLVLDLLSGIDPHTDWRKRFIDLIKRYPSVPVAHMGFPEDWRERDLWRWKARYNKRLHGICKKLNILS